MSQNHTILILIAVLSFGLLYFMMPEEKQDSISTLEGVTLTSLHAAHFGDR